MNTISCSLISKTRQLLMGIAILGVLIGHWFALSGFPADNIILRALKFIPQLVFTQGFLLLSGFGLYYSFCKNDDVKAFYQRRFTRLLIPFMIMICPFLVYFTIRGDINVWQFIGRLTSVSYWIEGNYYGMWYIALSVVLYLLYPFLHKMMMSRDSFWNVTSISLLLLVVFIATTRFAQCFVSEFYHIHNHAFNGAFMFIVGMYLAYLSMQNALRQQMGGGFLLVLFCISFLFKRYEPSYLFFYEGLKKAVIFIPVICLFFNLTDRFKPVRWIRNVLEWFGSYTLELYVLHLLFYCFLTNAHLGLNLSPAISITIAEIAILLLCKPINKGVNLITSKILKS